MNFEIWVATRSKDGELAFSLHRLARSDASSLQDALDYVLDVCDGWTPVVKVNGKGRPYAYYYDFDEPNRNGSIGEWLLTRSPATIEPRPPSVASWRRLRGRAV